MDSRVDERGGSVYTLCVVRDFADLNASLRKLGFRKTSNSRKSLFRNCAKSRWLKQHFSRRRVAEFRICRVESATGVKTNDFWSRYGGQFQGPGRGPEVDTGEHFLAPCSADFFHAQGQFSDHRRVPTAGSPNVTHITILRFPSAPAERVFGAPFPRVWDGPEVRIRSRFRRLN